MNRVRQLVLLVALIALSGCGFTGVNSVPLPLSKGSGGDAVRITVYLEDAANLVANSEVRYNEVVVGSVRRMTFDGWRAKLSVGLEKDARVPADVGVKVAQKSLLGAEYLELSASPGAGAEQLMADGDVVGIDRTSRYPEPEEVLAGAALLLNGGGLPQVKTITSELNNALGGREADVRSYVKQLRDFVTALDDQSGDILLTLEQLDRFSRRIVSQDEQVDRALVELPGGIRALADDREDLIAALSALGDLGDTTHRIVATSEDDLRANLASLTPITKSVVDSGTSIGRAFNALATPFTVNSVDEEFRSDYLNLFATINVSVPELDKFFLGGTPLDGLFTGLLGSLPTGTIADAVNPLLPPLGVPDLPAIGSSEAPATDSTTGSLPVPAPSAPAPSPDLLSLLLGGK